MSDRCFYVGLSVILKVSFLGEHPCVRVPPDRKPIGSFELLPCGSDFTERIGNLGRVVVSVPISAVPFLRNLPLLGRANMSFATIACAPAPWYLFRAIRPQTVIHSVKSLTNNIASPLLLVFGCSRPVLNRGSEWERADHSEGRPDCGEFRISERCRLI